MDITTLAAWGEFLGGIAVVVSLVYLAVQIRTNTKTIRASNYSDLLLASTGFSTMTVDPETASLYLRGLDSFEGLSAEDQIRFHGLMSQLIGPISQAFVLHQQTLLDGAGLESQTKSLPSLFENAGVRQWWEANQHWWPNDFVEFANDLLREGEAAG